MSSNKAFEEPNMNGTPGIPSPALSLESMPSLGQVSASTAMSRKGIKTPHPATGPDMVNPKGFIETATEIPTHAEGKKKKTKALPKVWLSDHMKFREELREKQRDMLTKFNKWDQIFENETLADWVDHQATKLALDKSKLCREIERAELALLERKSKPTLLPAFLGRELSEGRGAVLGQETIWCQQPDQRFGGTIWPSKDEFEYEGDGRAISGYGRCLPLVRNRDHTTQHRPLMGVLRDVPELAAHEFDAVDRRQDRIDTSYVDVEEDVIPDLLNSDLLQAIETIDIDSFDLLDNKPTK